jgi:hypothetical protein
MKELRDRIVRAAECVTNETSANTQPEAAYRSDVHRATNGVHIDTYLST